MSKQNQDNSDENQSDDDDSGWGLEDYKRLNDQSSTIQPESVSSKKKQVDPYSNPFSTKKAKTLRKKDTERSQLNKSEQDAFSEKNGKLPKTVKNAKSNKLETLDDDIGLSQILEGVEFSAGDRDKDVGFGKDDVRYFETGAIEQDEYATKGRMKQKTGVLVPGAGVNSNIHELQSLASEVNIDSQSPRSPKSAFKIDEDRKNYLTIGYDNSKNSARMKYNENEFKPKLNKSTVAPEQAILDFHDTKT